MRPIIALLTSRRVTVLDFAVPTDKVSIAVKIFFVVRSRSTDSGWIFELAGKFSVHTSTIPCWVVLTQRDRTSNTVKDRTDMCGKVQELLQKIIMHPPKSIRYIWISKSNWVIPIASMEMRQLDFELSTMKWSNNRFLMPLFLKRGNVREYNMSRLVIEPVSYH